MSGFIPPSTNPADEGEVLGALRVLRRTMELEFEDCLPAEVIAVSEDRRRVTVKPMIMVGTEDGQKFSRAQIVDVPLFTLGGGGFLVSVPVKPGDPGWIKATDRDISLYLQGNLAEEWPNTERTHSFSDGWFIPHWLKAWVLDEEDRDCLVIQNAEGTVRASFGEASVIITAPLIKLDAPETEITGNVQIDGDVTVAGEATIGGIAFTPHTHGNVQNGPGSTGGPQ